MLNVEYEAFKLITKYDKYNPTCKWDYKQYSWGYQTKCDNPGDKISEPEARKIIKKIIKDIRYKYNFYPYEDNIEVSLISFTYNLGHPPEGYKRYIKNGYLKALTHRMSQYVYAGNKKLRGLVIRRSMEGEIVLNSIK